MDNQKLPVGQIAEMRIRKQGDYKAFFTNSGKTIRFTNAAPLTTELEDVAINNKCLANCSYCYTDAKKSGNNFTNIISKALDVYGNIPLNDRPFQIAIGGAGEPTMHPDFAEFVSCIKDLGIMPNYTTNGMHLSNTVLKATNDYCGGVALSWHPHISKVFHKAVAPLKEVSNKLNVHIIVGTEKSFEDLKYLYERYENVFDYFVLLPYQAVGRGKEIKVEHIWNKTFDWIKTVNTTKFAFGALFWNYLQNNETGLEMSIYNPDVYSGYRLLNDNYKTLYKSSYELTEKSIN